MCDSVRPDTTRTPRAVKALAIALALSSTFCW